MKLAANFILLFLIVFLSSCYTDSVIGPQGQAGPQGPVGPQGAQGESGFVFEQTNVSFTAPDYEFILAYPENFEGFDSDVAVAYLLWGTYTNANDEVVEVWRQLTQTVLTEQGTLLYNFDFSKYDSRIFLEANFPRENLTVDYTDDWIVRVVVVPGSFWDSGRVDFSDYNEVEELLGLPKLNQDRGVVQRFL